MFAGKATQSRDNPPEMGILCRTTNFFDGYKTTSLWVMWLTICQRFSVSNEDTVRKIYIVYEIMDGAKQSKCIVSKNEEINEIEGYLHRYLDSVNDQDFHCEICTSRFILHLPLLLLLHLLLLLQWALQTSPEKKTKIQWWSKLYHSG